jgi:hypothetical protein
MSISIEITDLGIRDRDRGSGIGGATSSSCLIEIEIKIGGRPRGELLGNFIPSQEYFKLFILLLFYSVPCHYIVNFTRTVKIIS